MRGDVATGYSDIGDVLLKQGKTRLALENYQKATAMAEELRKIDRADEDLHTFLASCYKSNGKASAQLAADEKAPFSSRISHWREARMWFERSQKDWLDMRQRGALRGLDAGKPDEIAGEIARCDAALAKLQVATNQRRH
ncbi:MAG: hypothetical protein ACREEM_31310 [Blastocatellia bacterium]